MAGFLHNPARTTGLVVSAVAGSVTVTALVGPEGAEVALTDEVTVSFDVCLTDEQFYEQNLQTAVFSRCIGCHNDFGRAPEVVAGAMSFKWPDEAGATEHNLSWIELFTFERPSDDGTQMLPYLLAKPTAAIAHGGGEVLHPARLV